MTRQHESPIHPPQPRRSLRPRNPKPVATSPATQSKKPKSRRRTQLMNGDDGWWNINKILNERWINGKREYLVDWAGEDPDTGGSYTPTWETEIRDDARIEWEAEKAKRSKGIIDEKAAPLLDADEDERSTESDRNHQVSALTNEARDDCEDDDDQRPGPVNWYQIERAIAPGRTHSRSNSLDESTKKRPNKRLRIEPPLTPSVEPTPSIASAASTYPDLGSPVSTQELTRLERQRFIVEISKEPAIDRSEYLSVSNTQGSSQLVSELEDEDSRFALASQISQETIPDSQDLSADLWSQLELERITAPEYLESSNDLGGAPNIPTSSLVIPDSQDVSLNNLLSGNGISQELDSLQLDQVTPYQSQKDIAPDSVAPEVDIPSHQPNPTQPSQPQVRESEAIATAPASHSCDHLACEAINSSDHQPSRPTASSSEPVFLTQPRAFLDFSLPQSSFASQVSESCRGIAIATSNSKQRNQIIESTSSLETEASNVSSHPQDTAHHVLNVHISDPSQSQAAQIVQRDFDSSPEKISDSNNSHIVGQTSESVSETIQSSKTPNSPPVSQRQVLESIASQPSILGHSIFPEGGTEANRDLRESQIRPWENTGSPSRSPALPVPQGSNMTGRPPRRSAVDEILEQMDLSPIEFSLSSLDPAPDAHPQASPELVSEQQLALPFTSESATVAPEVTIESPELDIHSQPLFQTDSWSAAVTENAQDNPPQSISPASIMNNPERSAIHQIQGLHLPFSQSASSTLMPEIFHEPQTTVSPAEITNSVEVGDASRTILTVSDHLPTSPIIDESSGQSVTMGQIVDENEYGESSSAAADDKTPLDHIITLPFQTSRREPYDNILCEYQVQSTEFGRIFSSEILKDPDEALVKEIDELFGRLFNICDYPQDLVGTKLEELPTAEQAKYSCDANPKFNFVFEFLHAITKETGILVVARTPELLRLLFNLTVSLELDCVSEAIGQLDSNYKDTTGVRVNLALPNEDIDPFKYDVVIGFDYKFSSSTVARRLSTGKDENRSPLVLQLVTTYSIEHIDLHIPQDLSENEKKNALLSGVVKARKLVRNLECHPTIEPYEVVEVFTNYLNGIEESLSWEPQPMPDSVLDIFVNSQARSQLPLTDRTAQGNNLKRKLDDDADDAEDDDSKRVRTLSFKEPTTESNDPPLTYEIREFLTAGLPKDATHSRREAKISVPLATLEVLTTLFSELQRRVEANDHEVDERVSVINRLESQVKEFQRTTHKQSEALRTSLSDRSSFENEKRKAEDAAKSATEAAQKEVEKAQKRTAELETTIALLTAAPEGSEESPAALTAKLLKEAQDKVQVLERRLENAHKDNDYMRNLYQEVNGRAGVLGSENKELQEQNKELGAKASENLREIHAIQRDSTIKAHVQTITDLRAQMREKEIELDRTRDELRLLRNGRPQTRQASVPRSPRMGMMSPRPGRVSASRGTSPAPVSGHEGNGSGGISGMQFMGQQPGNGRWNHLRD